MRLFAIQTIQDPVGMIPEGHEFEVRTDAEAEVFIKSGQAVKVGTRLPWEPLQWQGTTALIIASGPSLTAEDCDSALLWRRDSDDRRTIVINTSYQRAPWADVLYACDDRWWGVYYDRVLKEFNPDGELWTQDRLATGRFERVRTILSDAGEGLNKRKGVINQGSNSGYQAIGLAYQAGVRKIILLGYDFKDGPSNAMHWHPDHPKPLHSFPQYQVWVTAMGRLAKDLKAAGIEVVNATRSTALTCFPRVAIEEALR